MEWIEVSITGSGERRIRRKSCYRAPLRDLLRRLHLPEQKPVPADRAVGAGDGARLLRGPVERPHDAEEVVRVHPGDLNPACGIIAGLSRGWGFAVSGSCAGNGRQSAAAVSWTMSRASAR